MVGPFLKSKLPIEKTGLVLISPVWDLVERKTLNYTLHFFKRELLMKAFFLQLISKESYYARKLIENPENWDH